MIYKSFPAETKVLDPQRGLVETVFSVTGNLDRQGDIIDPGAFNKALGAKQSVPVVYAHQWNDLDAVLGKTVGWKELWPGDPALPESLRAKGLGGVKATVQFDQETPAGRLALTHVKNKNLTDWSFAFDIDDDGEKQEDNARHIKSIREVFEVTLALIGANPDTVTMALKGMAAEDSKQNVPGSFEDRQSRLYTALRTLVSADDYPYIVATFDDRIIYSIDYGSGDGWSVPYSIGNDGTVSLGTPEAVRISAVITPKSLQAVLLGLTAYLLSD